MSTDATLPLHSELNLNSTEDEEGKLAGTWCTKHEQSDDCLENDATKTLQDVKLNILKRSTKVHEISQGCTSKPVLKEQAKMIIHYLTGEGNLLSRIHPELYASLLQAVNFALKSACMEDMIAWAEGLNIRLKSLFYEFEIQLYEMNQKCSKAHTKENLYIAEMEAVETVNIRTVPTTTTQQLQFKALKRSAVTKTDLSRNEMRVKRDQSFIPHVTKRLKEQQEVLFSLSQTDLNTPDENGDYLLLRSLRRGEGIKFIKQMLTEGADVNVVSKDNRKVNAAYETVQALVHNRVTYRKALDILNILMKHGFNLLNEGYIDGFTPLHISMYYENMNEEFLEWFYKNKADFNAITDDNGDSPLFIAIWKRQMTGILRKIIEFGGNASHVNKWKENALHVSARHANVEAMEILLDELDINARDIDNDTPLHVLFDDIELDYSKCLKLLVEKGADFNARCRVGYVPLINWIVSCECDIFQVLMKSKDWFPISSNIASAALTFIVKKMDSLQNFLPCVTRGGQSDLAQFITFLVKEKKGILKLKGDDAWELLKWEEMKQNFTRNLVNKLKKNGVALGKEKLTEIKSASLGTVSMLFTESKNINVTIEIILVCLLACRKLDVFVNMCRVVEMFCINTRVSE